MTGLALAGGTPAAATAAAPSSALYRAVWRFHFYAGLLVLPFMILLAVTGAIYLFKDEIEGVVYRPYHTVEARPGAAPLDPDRLAAKALVAYPGARVMSYRPAPEETASAQIGVRTATGERLNVYVDPFDGRVLGATPHKGTVMWIVRRVHSLDYFGPVANGLIEVVAGWAVVLVATGFYLWWPRRQSGGVVTVRGRLARRVFWRDLHAVTGAFAGLLIAFLALSGLPWSVFWGKQVNQITAAAGLGYPAGLYAGVPTSEPVTSHADHLGHTAWTLETAPMPASPPSTAAAIGLDRAVAVFKALGLPKGYVVTLPAGERGVYTAAVYPDDIAQQRVVHLDQYTGRPLLDLRLADYGTAARAIEWGIGLHMGQPFGLANQLIMLAACLAIVLMSVSALVMWWKRRPKGSLGAPPAPRDQRILRGLLAIMGLVGVAFPLTGLSLLIALAIDWLLARPRRAQVAAALALALLGVADLARPMMA